MSCSKERTKQALRDLREVAIQLAQQKDIISRLESGLGLGLKSPQIKEIQVQGSTPQDSGAILDRIIEAKDKLEELQEEHDKRVEQHFITLVDLAVTNADYAQIIHMRYFLGWRWEAIQTETHYSETQAYRIHRDALDAYFTAFKKRWE